MSVNCSHEKNDILYNKARTNVKNGNGKRILWYDVDESEPRFDFINLDKFVPDEDKGKRPVESMVVSECLSRDKPLDMRECEFWDYLHSNDWSDGSSLRVLTGRLQSEIINGLAYMENIGLITHLSTYAYAVNIRRRKICYRRKKSKTGMDDILTRKETILLEFGYYGPYRETRRPKYRKESGSSGYQESYTSPFPPLSSTSLSTSGAEQSEERLDVNARVEELPDTSETRVVSSVLQTKEFTSNLPLIKTKHAPQQSHILNGIISQKETRVGVKDNTVIAAPSSFLQETLLPLVCNTTYSNKKGTPKLSDSHTYSLEMSSTLSQQGEMLSQLISGHSAEDSHINKISSQAKNLHIPSMTLKKNLRYSGSSTDSSLISAAGTVSLQNFICTEKVFYLGSFDLDSQSDSEGSENEDAKMERRSKLECLLGDVNSVKEREPVINKLKRKNQKRMEERKQKMTIPKECPKTLSSLMIWPELKEEDIIIQYNTSVKELFSNTVPDFTDLNNISDKYKKEAIMLRKEKMKQRATQNNGPNTDRQENIQAEISHVEQPNKQTKIKNTEILEKFEKFVETVRGITDSAACKKFCTDHIILLDWLERHNLQETVLYRNLITSKETFELQKVIDDKLFLPRPYLKKETVRMKLGDVKNNETKMIKEKKKDEKKGKNGHANINKEQKEIRKKKKSIDSNKEIIEKPFHTNTEKKIKQKKKKPGDLVNGDNHIPLGMVTKDRPVTGKVLSLGKESPNSSSEEEDLSDGDSTFDVKKLNFRYSIENLPNKRHTETKPNPLEILKKYFRIQKIARAFCTDQSVSGVKPAIQLPKLWEKKLGKKGGLKNYLTKPENIGRLKWFSFLSKADVKQKSPDVKPAFEMTYTTDFIVNNLLKAMEAFVVRKETVVSDYKGETCMSITFTKPSVFQNYKRIDHAC
ncbi:hypothetical protein ACJMK2_035202 [Sinanodonta woodiana]|uniref:Uncharacterized protein n=1 Tax=Sinanodonta woodiana TaxID=1069815 RepID=A0ABD3WW77_SINWO